MSSRADPFVPRCVIELFAFLCVGADVDRITLLPIHAGDAAAREKASNDVVAAFKKFQVGARRRPGSPFTGTGRSRARGRRHSTPAASVSECQERQVHAANPGFRWRIPTVTPLTRTTCSARSRAVSTRLRISIKRAPPHSSTRPSEP
eukprot:3053195-Prymnesium_polylepis.1